MLTITADNQTKCGNDKGFNNNVR